MSQQYWNPHQCPPVFISSAAFNSQQPDLTMSYNAPLNRENFSNSTRDLYIQSRDLDTTALQYRAPKRISTNGGGLRTSGDGRGLQGPRHHPLIVPVLRHPITHTFRSDGTISRSGPSMPSGAAQPPYLPFGPPHCARSNFILPPRPRGPISTILDGWNNELPRSQAPGSGRPRHEHFDLAGSAVTPFPRQANGSAPMDIPHSHEILFDPPSLSYPTIRHEIDTTAPENHLPLLSSPHYGIPLYLPVEAMPPNGGGECIVYPRMDANAQFQAPGRRVYPLGTSAHDLPTSQTSDLLLAIDQLRPSFTSPSCLASVPSYLRSSVDSSHSSITSPPPPRSREPDFTTFGMKESMTFCWASLASGRPQHENFGQGVPSIAIESASPIEQQPRKSKNSTNRNPCNLCKRWHVRCVVVADELGPLCARCKKKGVKCKFPKK